MLLGGRAAETLVFEEVSTGDDDDLAKVTDIARSVGVRYGIDDRAPQRPFEESADRSQYHRTADQPVRKYSEETVREIDRAVRRLVDKA